MIKLMEKYGKERNKTPVTQSLQLCAIINQQNLPRYKKEEVSRRKPPLKKI